MYHKVDIVTPTVWWVTPGDLARQLEQVASRRRFVYLDDYTSPKSQAVVTFDDAYENVARHAAPILAAKGIPFELFVIASRIGDWNDGDTAEPLTRYMGMSELEAAVAAGARLQWHSKSHRWLPGLAPQDLDDELQVTPELAARFGSEHFRWLSYPYGGLDAAAVQLARQRFRGAVSVLDGDPSDRWQLHRVTVDRYTQF
jgi:peptidoglycan/xylan/chitin deacetylase (PgdA/CDA1 family)